MDVPGSCPFVLPRQLWKVCIKNIYTTHDLMHMNNKSIFMNYWFLVCKEYTSSPKFAVRMPGCEKHP